MSGSMRRRASADTNESRETNVALVEKPAFAHVLAVDGISRSLARLWSPQHKVIAERLFWVELLRAQQEAGLLVPNAVIRGYEKNIFQVDLDSIDRRERICRHDVKARIEEFNALAGHEYIHNGLTGRDLDDNIEQAQIRSSLQISRTRSADICRILDACLHSAGSENWPNSLDESRIRGMQSEVAQAQLRIDNFLTRYPLRGIKGPAGTSQDMLDLLGGDRDKLTNMENRLVAFLGFTRVLTSTGQVYPRSLDLEALTLLVQLAKIPARVADILLRYVAPRASSEGITFDQHAALEVVDLGILLRGYTNMISQLAGDQWNEGDVSCSVVRRVAIPGAFFAFDRSVTMFGMIVGES